MRKNIVTISMPCVFYYSIWLWQIFMHYYFAIVQKELKAKRTTFWKKQHTKTQSWKGGKSQSSLINIIPENYINTHKVRSIIETRHKWTMAYYTQENFLFFNIQLTNLPINHKIAQKNSSLLISIFYFQMKWIFCKIIKVTNTFYFS